MQLFSSKYWTADSKSRIQLTIVRAGEPRRGPDRVLGLTTFTDGDFDNIIVEPKCLLEPVSEKVASQNSRKPGCRNLIEPYKGSRR